MNRSFANRAKVSLPVHRARVATVGPSTRGFLDAIDDLDLPSGARVLLSPNWVSAEPPPIATSLDLVREVIGWLQDKYATKEIVVGDMPPNRWNSERGMMEQGEPIDVYRAFGVLDWNLAGVRVALFDQEEWIRKPAAPNGTWPSGIAVPKAALDCDAIIKLVQLKTHWITGFSGVLKGLMGLLPLDGTRYVHQDKYDAAFGLPAVPQALRQRRGYCDRIAAIATACRPSYCIIDARTAFAAIGPGRGPIVEPRWMAATSDTITAELMCLSLLRWIWRNNLTTHVGKPVRQWYEQDGPAAIPPEHNGRIDVLERFPLRSHPMIEAAVACGLWQRAHEPVVLHCSASDKSGSAELAEAIGADLQE